MRIAYVCTDPGVPVYGTKGASVHVQAIVTGLVRRGDEVHIVTPRPGGRPPAGLAGVGVHQLSRAGCPDAAAREVATQAADAQAWAVLDQLHEQEPLDLVYERYSLWGRSASAWSRHAGVPHLLEINAPLVEEQQQHRVLVDRAGAQAAAAAAISSATAVLCVTEPVARWAAGHTPDPARVHVLPNGVDTSRITPARGGPRGPSDPFVVGFVGTLKPWHGVQTLLSALALLTADDPSYRLLLVGDGPEAASLAETADRLGVRDQVEMTGALDPERIPEQLHRMDVAIAPYPALADFYFSPLKVYEYLAAGLPVVASDVGDLPDILDGGRLGVLVEPDQPAELAAAIAALRADPQRRALLAREGRAQAVRRHDWSDVLSRALSLAGRS